MFPDPSDYVDQCFAYWDKTSDKPETFSFHHTCMICGEEFTVQVDSSDDTEIYIHMLGDGAGFTCPKCKIKENQVIP